MHRLKKIKSSKFNNQAEINTARALKAGFASYGIAEQNVIYALGKHGKPYASNFPQVHFSISHSDNMAVIAFYNKEIGIDCEKSPKKITAEILHRFFQEDEARDFATNPLLLWCAKEAAVKYTGKGFVAGRGEHTIPYFEDEISFDGIWLKRIGIDGFECVVCCDKADAVSITEV